jgi:thioredoxin 1
MASEHVLELNDSNFNSTVASAGVLLVDFWAPWCGPCRMIAPVIEELGKELAGTVTVAKVNVDEAGQTASAHNVTSIPTIMIFKNGQLADRSTGLASKAALLAKIQAL